MHESTSSPYVQASLRQFFITKLNAAGVLITRKKGDGPYSMVIAKQQRESSQAYQTRPPVGPYRLQMLHSCGDQVIDLGSIVALWPSLSNVLCHPGRDRKYSNLRLLRECGAPSPNRFHGGGLGINLGDTDLQSIF